jgi:hypothetical protein
MKVYMLSEYGLLILDHLRYSFGNDSSELKTKLRTNQRGVYVERDGKYPIVDFEDGSKYEINTSGVNFIITKTNNLCQQKNN